MFGMARSGASSISVGEGLMIQKKQQVYNPLTLSQGPTARKLSRLPKEIGKMEMSVSHRFVCLLDNLIFAQFY